MGFGVGKFDVIVMDAYRTESGKGTPGLGFKLRADKGEDLIWHTEWISDKTKENFVKRMKAFGIEPDVLESEEFWEDPAVLLAGKKATIETESDDYEGKSRIKVKWLNGQERKASSASVFASLFAKTPFD